MVGVARPDELPVELRPQGHDAVVRARAGRPAEGPRQHRLRASPACFSAHGYRSSYRDVMPQSAAKIDVDRVAHGLVIARTQLRGDGGGAIDAVHWYATPGRSRVDRAVELHRLGHELHHRALVLPDRVEERPHLAVARVVEHAQQAARSTAVEDAEVEAEARGRAVPMATTSALAAASGGAPSVRPMYVSALSA